MFRNILTYLFQRRAGWVVAAGLLTGLTGCDGCRPQTQDVGEVASSAGRLSPEVVARHNRAVALMGQFDYAAAVEQLEPLVAEYPDWVDAKIDLAIASLNRRQTGDSEKAVSLLRAAIAQEPENLRAHYCLGILSLDGGDPQAALALFAKVAADDPRDAYAVYYAGQCEFQLGQVAEALARYEQVMERDPYLRSCYYGAFQAALRLGQTERADEFRQAFERLDKNPQARLAEIKYTRMGPKAELQTLAPVAGDASAPPEGEVFAAGQPLQVGGPSAVPWADDPAAARLTVVDLTGEGRLTLCFAGASRDAARPNVMLQQKGETWEWLADHPLSTVTGVQAVAWGDYDNDGLVDAYLARTGANQLWRQTAPGQWQEVTESTGTAAGDVPTIDVQFFDADHDGDLDLLLANDGPTELLNNNLDGTFRPLAAQQGLAGQGTRSQSSLVADLDGDRDLDLVIVKAQPPHEVYLNDRLWAYRPATGLDEWCNHPWLAVVAADRDADGQTELLALDADGLTITQPDRQGQWQVERLRLALPAGTQLQAPMAAADVNGDGSLDLICSSTTGGVVVDLADGSLQQSLPALGAWRLANLSAERGPSLIALAGAAPQILQPGPGRYDFLTISFTGKEAQAEQMRSNRSGIGVDAAARLGSRWTSLRTLRSDSGPGQNLQPLAVGLRGRSQLDFVRLTWPDGVFQTELDLGRGQLHRVAETQRQVASCPVVFAWNGQTYQFVTDVLGGGGLGFNLGYGQYGEPRPWEHLLLGHQLLQPREGRYEIKVGEPMEEACYLDAARLVAYDLPADWQMTLDERFAVEGPAPSGRAIFYRQVHEPIHAVNDRGQSVLDAVCRADGVAAEPGERDRRFIGRTAPHWIELTFAEPIDHTQPYLLFDGWIEYPYSQTMFAAWQAGAAFEAPTVDAAAADGSWQTVAARFGYMAGMPRQAALPLELARLPAGTTRLRIRCNLEIYWDRLTVIHAEQPPTMIRRELPLHDARVAEVGFARRTTLAQHRPWYDYQHRAPLWDTRHLAGIYSQFGPASPLVQQVDDAVAIIGPGEEVHLEFEASLPAAVADQRRWFVLELYGWCKDMDLYTQDGETVAPLPVRGIERSEAERQRRQQLHQQNHRRYQAGY